MRLYVGCAMWAHKAWRHVLGPGARGGALAPYAAWCNAVEGNATFYAEPSASTVAGWAAQTPTSFRFAFKLPKVMTHDRRLRVSAGEVATFVRRLEPLGERAAPIVVQLPATFGPADLPTLAAFVRAKPSGVRYAVELRHRAFFDGGPAAAAVESMLADAGAEWTIFDTTTLFARPPTSDAEREAWVNKPRVPARAVALGEFPVVRYLGRDDVSETVAGWQRWVPVVAAWLRERRTPTFFVHTPNNDDALVLARRFHAAVAAVVPELEPLGEPDRPDEPITLF